MLTYLTGFMCSGKTRVGKALATRLGQPWFDVDRVVEERIGPLLPYIQLHGEAAFRREEADVLAALARESEAVISCGGGTPLNDSLRALMKRTGVVVFLDVTFPVLMERIERAGGDRPLLFGLRGEALEARVRQLLEERLAVYREADVIVPADDPWERVAEAVERALRTQER